MEFVEPSVVAVNELDLTKKIEHCYRICYQSESKMTDSNAFLLNLLNMQAKNKHYSPLEHARIVIKVDGRIAGAMEEWERRRETRFMKVDYDYKDEHGAYQIRVTANFRSLREFVEDFDPDFDRNGNYSVSLAIAQYAISAELNKHFPVLINKIENFPQGILPESVMLHLPCTYIGEADDYQTFRVVTSRDMLQQYSRHRSHSFSVESTKFIDYTKKGFTFCIPRPYEWANVDWNAITAYHPDTVEYPNPQVEIVVKHANLCERAYFAMMKTGVKRFEARICLPGMYKTELFLSATRRGWMNFISLRDDDHADPQIHYIAKQIHDYLKENKKEWFK